MQRLDTNAQITNCCTTHAASRKKTKKKKNLKNAKSKNKIKSRRVARLLFFLVWKIGQAFHLAVACLLAFHAMPQHPTLPPTLQYTHQLAWLWTHSRVSICTCSSVSAAAPTCVYFFIAAAATEICCNLGQSCVSIFERHFDTAFSNALRWCSSQSRLLTLDWGDPEFEMLVTVIRMLIERIADWLLIEGLFWLLTFNAKIRDAIETKNCYIHTNTFNCKTAHQISKSIRSFHHMSNWYRNWYKCFYTHIYSFWSFLHMSD